MSNNSTHGNGKNNDGRHNRSVSFTDDFNAFVAQMASCNLSLRNLNRKQRMVDWARRGAWALLIGDIYFSYWSLHKASGNQVFAAMTAIAVGCVQWAVSAALYSRAVREIFVIDRNDNGTIELWEWVRMVLIVGAAVIFYVIDIVTNGAGIDRINVGATLVFPFVDPSPEMAEVVTWVLAFMLMMADETIHVFVDPVQKQIDVERPRIRQNYARLKAKERMVSSYESTLLERAGDIGRTRGERETL